MFILYAPEFYGTKAPGGIKPFAKNCAALTLKSNPVSVYRNGNLYHVSNKHKIEYTLFKPYGTNLFFKFLAKISIAYVNYKLGKVKHYHDLMNIMFGDFTNSMELIGAASEQVSLTWENCGLHKICLVKHENHKSVYLKLFAEKIGNSPVYEIIVI